MHNQIGLPKLYLVPQKIANRGLDAYIGEVHFNNKYFNFYFDNSHEDATHILDEQRFLYEISTGKMLGHLKSVTTKPNGLFLRHVSHYWSIE